MGRDFVREKRLAMEMRVSFIGIELLPFQAFGKSGSQKLHDVQRAPVRKKPPDHVTDLSPVERCMNPSRISSAEPLNSPVAWKRFHSSSVNIL